MKQEIKIINLKFFMVDNKNMSDIDNDTNPNFKNLKENSVGVLYVIATPIGNLEDITFRAVQKLKEVDYILCENIAHSRKLLDHLGIKKKLLPYNDFTFEKERNKIVSHLLKGAKMALISDAGTPLISDPGYKLISQLHQHNFSVIPIPGACSIITALSVAGVPTDKFLYLGFLPSSVDKAEQVLKNYISINASIICLESPKRLLQTLKTMLNLFGNRNACIARELTKIHEEINYKSLEMLIDEYENKNIKGEIVILVEGNKDFAILDDNAISEILKDTIKEEISVSEAVKLISQEFNLNKKRVYDIALRLK